MVLPIAFTHTAFTLLRNDLLFRDSNCHACPKPGQGNLWIQEDSVPIRPGETLSCFV
jgi:hypothetical protein